ncbi:MAG: hypothetical protein MZU97_21815 [Bacillus subtilis]|nr:hypothetical protein [Bacillus subtilis]
MSGVFVDFSKISLSFEPANFLERIAHQIDAVQKRCQGHPKSRISLISNQSQLPENVIVTLRIVAVFG